MSCPILLLEGDQGSGKTSTANALGRLIDPSASQSRAAPRNQKDLLVGCAGSRMIGFDNQSEISPSLSDDLCKVVSGVAFITRKLYTNAEISSLIVKRAITMTAITLPAIAGDLGDRLIRIPLDRIPAERRTDEGLLHWEWRRDHPVILAGLLDLAVKVQAILPKIRHTDLPRMADYGRMLLAVDQILDTKGYRRYETMTQSVTQRVIADDLVAAAIVATVTEPVTMSAGDLLECLRSDTAEWNQITPRAMSSRLQRATASLRAVGWTVTKIQPTGHPYVTRWLLSPPR